MLIASEKEIAKMKKRSMILALASMLGISAAATAVSGFAWFTTQTTAQISEHNYFVGAAQGDLVIGAVAANDINCLSQKAATGNAIEVAPTASTALADVSSIDGENFYKLANIDLNNHTADMVKEADKTGDDAGDKVWMSTVNDTQMVCVSWSMTVANGGDANTSMNVFLSHDGDLFTATGTAAKDDNNQDVANYVDAYRLAIFDNGSLVYFYAKSTSGMTSADFNSTAGTYIYDSTKLWDGTGYTGDHATTAHLVASAANVLSTDAVSKKDSQLLISNLVGQATAHTLKFVVWCEGTDTPERAVKAGNQVKLGLDLVGLNAK